MPRRNKQGNMKRIKWIAFREERELIMGKKRKRVDDEWMIMEYYVEDKMTKEIRKCKGCDKNK
jgi:hypothetical protein